MERALAQDSGYRENGRGSTEMSQFRMQVHIKGTASELKNNANRCSPDF
jgi:hypothetical protein